MSSISTSNSTNISDDGINSANGSLVSWLTVCVFIGLMSLIGHGLIARTVYRHPALNYAPYHLLINIGVCDVWFSLIIMLIGVFSGGDQVMLNTAQLTGRIAFICSLFTSSCLAFDRVLSVRFLLTYQFFARRRISIIMILFSWLAAGICNGIIMGVEYRTDKETLGVPKRYSSYLILSITIFLTSFFICFTLFYIKLETFREIKKLTTLTTYLHGEKAEQLEDLRRRQKVNFDVTVVSVFSIVVVSVVGLIFFKLVILPSNSDDTWILVNWVIGTLYCAINPIVYLKSMRKLKRFFVRDVQKTWQKITRACHNNINPEPDS